MKFGGLVTLCDLNGAISNSEWLQRMVHDKSDQCVGNRWVRAVSVVGRAATQAYESSC